MGDVLKLYVFDGADIKKCYQCDAYDVRLATVEDVAQDPATAPERPSNSTNII